MRRFGSTLTPIFAILLTASLPPSAWPQASTAMLSGTVHDQTSAVIGGASVSLTGQETNETSKTVTNGVGYYVFPGLVPGSYRLTVEASGMMKFEGTLVIQVQQSAVVDVNMRVGQTSAEVSVQDVTPLVATDNATLGDTLEHTRIEQLPLNGRAVMSLLQTVPGMEGTRAFGIRDGSEDVVVDGATIMDRSGWNTVNPRQPGLDSIQEFTVADNGTSAKYARPTTVVMSTKGGSNQLHGSAFETNRNNALGLARSRTDYYTKPPFLNRNEFGISGGGPVYIPKLYNGKNKTFWFFAYEALRQIQNTSQGFPVPTQAMRNGDMSGIADANGIHSTIYDPYSTDTATWARMPFSNNQIPNSMMSPLAKYLLAVTPLPTLPNVNGNVAPNWFGAVPSFVRSWTTSARVDQRLGDKDLFYFRYSQGNYSTRSQFYSQPTLDWTKVPSGTQGYKAPNKNAAVSWVHTFSPTLFNEVLVSGSYGPWFVGTGDLTHNYDGDMGLPNPFGVGGWPGLYSAGMDNVGNGFEFETQNTNAANEFYGILDDNATKVRGRHEFQFGFHYRFDQLDILPAQQQVAGNDNFATNATALYDTSSSRNNPQPLPYTGDNFANFYLGVANYSNQYVRGMFYARTKEYAAYFQDKYKVSSRLTLNLGLRYEFWPAFRAKNNAVVSFDKANQAIVLGTSLQNLETLGYTTPSIVAREQQLGVKFETYQQAGFPSTLETSNNLDFAPRLGFAYRLTEGARPIVIRGGYALSYFHIPTNPWAQRMRQNAPMNARFITSVTQASYSPDGIGNIGMRQAPSVIAGKNSINAVTTDTVGSLSAGSAVVDYFALNQSDPRVHNWNFTIEKEILSNTLFRASYIGNHSSALEQVSQFNLNTPAYIWYLTTGTALPTGPLASVATNAFNQTTYGFLENWQNTGWGNSNGVTLNLERRFSRGYAFQFFYVMDNNLAAGGQGYGGTSVLPAFNQFLPGTVPTNAGQFDRLYDYQRDTSIPKHRFSWNWVADLPFGKGKPLLHNSALLDKLVGGWQIAGIGSLRSTYFTFPSSLFPTSTPVELYGYKYPIQNCTSGTCYPGYLYYNGYIPANLINSHNAAGQPNGYEGIPSNYSPAGAPLIVYGQTTAPNAPAGTNMVGFYNSNTVWVPLKDGSVQRTTWAGLAPLRQQYFPGIWQWNTDASLFKTVAFRERLRLRLQADFFNVFNHPGNPNSFIGSTGILNVQSSGNSPRTLQLSGRLSW